jgi:hypothetical protein
MHMGMGWGLERCYLIVVRRGRDDGDDGRRRRNMMRRGRTAMMMILTECCWVSRYPQAKADLELNLIEIVKAQAAQGG